MPVAYRAREKLVVRKYVGAQKGSWIFHSNRVIYMTRRKKKPRSLSLPRSALVSPPLESLENDGCDLTIPGSYFRSFFCSPIFVGFRFLLSIGWIGVYGGRVCFLYTLFVSEICGRLFITCHDWFSLMLTNQRIVKTVSRHGRIQKRNRSYTYPARPKNRNSYNFQKALKLLRQW